MAAVVKNMLSLNTLKLRPNYGLNEVVRGRFISTTSSRDFLKKIFGKSSSEQAELNEYEEQLQSMEATLKEQEREESVEKLRRARNKSKLSASDRRRLQGEAPLRGVSLIFDSKERSKAHQMKMFGKYGTTATKISPSVAWPTPEELRDQEEFERVFYDGKGLKEMMKEIEEEKAAKVAKGLERDAEIDKNIVDMNKQLKMWKEKVSLKNKQAEIERQKQGRMLAELKEEFGYDIDPQLPQFQQAIQRKEAEIAKRDKDERKKLKAEKLRLKAEREAAFKADKDQQQQSSSPTSST